MVTTPVDEPRLVGGHVALDLVNTVAPREQGSPGRVEYVATPDGLLLWARRIRLVTDGEAESIHAAWAASPPSSIQALHASIDVREATYSVLIAALGAANETNPNAAHELERLNLRWAVATARSELVLGGPSGPAARLRVGTAPALLIADRLAHAAVDLVRTVDLGRLRVCPIPEGGCGWLFLDHSRNGSRRWCAMADCGAQAKSRRLTARRRADRAAAAASGNSHGK
jgi:predicted RNA-binding Zn ribbon-like protein